MALTFAGCLGDDADDGTGDDGIRQDPPLGDVLQWELGYVMEHGAPGLSGTVVVYDEDFHSSLLLNGTATEVYRIGTDLYVITDGECIQTTDTAGGGLLDPNDLSDQYRDVQASAVTTFDGIRVWRFDIDGGHFFVSTETGYPVLIEDAEHGSSIRFHSWGETEPIALPAGFEC